VSAVRNITQDVLIFALCVHLI